MSKLVITLHDQAVELTYPASLQGQIELLFGLRPAKPARRRTALFLISEINPGLIRFDAVEPGRFGRRNLSTAEFWTSCSKRSFIVLSMNSTPRSPCTVHRSAWRGRSVLIAGPKGAGKTSLTAWFAPADFEFLSDELVVLPGNGKTTLSFPRPLLAKPGADELIALMTRTGGESSPDRRQYRDRVSIGLSPAKIATPGRLDHLSELRRRQRTRICIGQPRHGGHEADAVQFECPQSSRSRIAGVDGICP